VINERFGGRGGGEKKKNLIAFVSGVSSLRKENYRNKGSTGRRKKRNDQEHIYFRKVEKKIGQGGGGGREGGGELASLASRNSISAVRARPEKGRGALKSIESGKRKKEQPV